MWIRGPTPRDSDLIGPGVPHWAGGPQVYLMCSLSESPLMQMKDKAMGTYLDSSTANCSHES